MIFSGTIRRASDTAGTPPVAILNGRRPMRLRASRPRWSVSEESCATGFREAGSISNLSSWNMDRMARKGAAPEGGPSLGGNAQGGLQRRGVVMGLIIGEDNISLTVSDADRDREAVHTALRMGHSPAGGSAQFEHPWSVGSFS